MKKEHAVNLQCSFCGKSQREVRKLIAGPTVYICDECIKLCNDIIAKEAEPRDFPPEEAAPRTKREGEANKSRQLLCCSFCGKTQREVRKLIAGPSVYICDECIGLCNDIIVEEIVRRDRVALPRVKLPVGVWVLIAGILERGTPAAVRVRDVLGRWVIRDTSRRLTAGEPPDEALWGAWNLAADWSDLQHMLTWSTAQPGESGKEGRLEARPPEWLNPIAERLAGTVEVLDVLARSLDKPGLGELRHLRPSIDIAVEKVREAREMLLARPSGGPEESS